MTIQHGAYFRASDNLQGPRDVDSGERNPPRCPVELSPSLWCTLPPAHANLECQHVTEFGSIPLGVAPVTGSVAFHDPDLDQRLPPRRVSSEELVSELVSGSDEKDPDEELRSLDSLVAAACLAYGVKPAEVTLEMRRVVKARVFSLLYGGGPDVSPPEPSEPPTTQRLNVVLPSTEFRFQDPPG